ncbi:hypothetical protein [Cellulosimicrobium sp. CUA-896]|uniref:hypothetical protein n=1 Tax=Cellulosimicrobium sp. CUA-896 TaxID=1517881 RepID=UPI0011150FEA|nr:hypothetical protein [Cellulosimicrobium sp. CUA-896]
MTARRLAGYELALPEAWVAIPSDLADVDVWARQEAERLVAAAPDRADVELRAASAPGEPAEDVDPVALLASGLAAVAGTAAGAGVRGLEAAALVRRPELGRVDAMVTLAAQQDLSRDAFVADLQGLVSGPEAVEHLLAQEVDAVVDAGEVRGLHLMLGHLEPDLGEGVAHLEERVALGVFPPGCADMIEVTAVANGVGAFDDMPQDVVDVLGGLAVDLEGTA